MGASPAAALSFVEPILEQTDSLQVATGIVNIWSAPPDEVAESYHRIEKAYPGRFLLGIGVGHPEHTEEYAQALRRTGPRVLKLARNRSAGAHPYLTTPEHTAQARELGREKVGFYLDQSKLRQQLASAGFHHRRRRQTGHLEAGADRIAIQVLGRRQELLPTLADLAGALGFSG